MSVIINISTSFSCFAKPHWLNQFNLNKLSKNMIKAITPLVTSLFLIVGSFLILTIPTWVTYVLFAALVITWSIHFIIKHHQMMSVVWNFCAEFIGFCFLVTLFVGTIVIMNGMLFNWFSWHSSSLEIIILFSHNE